MILVTGATGSVGSELVVRLCAGGSPTRALVRSPEKADALRGYDCEIAVGDYGDAAELDRAMCDVQAVFLVAPPSPDLPAQERNVLDAALRAGRPRVVKLASIGVGTPEFGRLADIHTEALAALERSGLPHTVLVPNLYMQDLLGFAAPVQESGLLPVPGGDAAVSHIDARDIAAVAAHVLTGPGHDGATYALTGPESLTYAEVAAELSRVLDRDVRYLDATPEQARAATLASGGSEWFADGLVEMLAAVRQGKAAKVTDEVARAIGRPARTMARFLAEHRAAFR